MMDEDRKELEARIKAEVEASMLPAFEELAAKFGGQDAVREFRAAYDIGDAAKQLAEGLAPGRVLITDTATIAPNALEAGMVDCPTEVSEIDLGDGRNVGLELWEARVAMREALQVTFGGALYVGGTDQEHLVTWRAVRETPSLGAPPIHDWCLELGDGRLVTVRSWETRCHPDSPGHVYVAVGCYVVRLQEEQRRHRERAQDAGQPPRDEGVD